MMMQPFAKLLWTLILTVVVLSRWSSPSLLLYFCMLVCRSLFTEMLVNGVCLTIVTVSEVAGDTK